MALPVTITSSYQIAGYGGPFISSAGNVYVILKGSSADHTIGAFKATDPTSSFAGAGTDVNVETSAAAGTVQSLDAFQVGDNIHVVTMSDQGGAPTLYNIKYHVFSMASDSWTTSNESVKAAFNPAPGLSEVISIGVRSDGDIIVLYQGPFVANMGSDRARVYYARKEASTWTVDVAVDNGGATNWNPGDLVMGSSDRAHFFLRDAGISDSYQRTLTSANALQTFPAAFNTNDGGYKALNGTSYVSGGATKVRTPHTSGAAINSVKFDSADAPTLSSDADITGATNPDAGFDRQCFSADGTTLWHSFRVSGDVYTQSNANDGGWSTPASFYTTEGTGLSTNVYTRGSSIVLAMVLQGTAGVVYHEKVLAAGSPTHATSGALAASGATLAGSASSKTTRTSTGALAPAGATLAGTAVHLRTHATSGALAPSGATLAGSASSATTRPSSGALAATGAALAGTAARTRQHATTGALAVAGAALAGTASSKTTRTSTGALAGTGATLAGTAVHLRPHATSGTLAASGAALAGAASRVVVHATTGALVPTGATLTGAASSKTTRPSSGALAASGATLAGVAARTRVHVTTAALVPTGATLSGAASSKTVRSSTGALAGGGAVLTGAASSKTTRPSSGALAATGAVLAGSAARNAGFVTHSTNGALAPIGAVLAGIASSATSRLSSGVLAGSGATLSGAAERSGSAAPSSFNTSVARRRSRL